MTTRREYHQSAPEPRRILLMIAGDDADVLRRTPYVKAIRKRYPSGHLTALVSERGAAGLKNCPYLDELIFRRTCRRETPRLKYLWEKGIQFLALWWRLWRRFDLIVALLTPGASGPLWFLLAFCSGARRRVGYDLHHNGRLLTHDLGRADPSLPDEDHLDRILTTIGIRGLTDDGCPEIWPTAEDDRAATLLLQENGIVEEDSLIAICPGSDWSCQQWDCANWAVVADHLVATCGVRILVLGTANETYLADRLASHMKHHLADLTGRTTLGELACVLRRCRLALTLESAPCAVALAVGVPTVALFHSSPMWIRSQHCAAALGIRKCEGIVPNCFTRCKLAKMSQAVHRCQNDLCTGGDGLRQIVPRDVLRATRLLLDRTTQENEYSQRRVIPLRVVR